MRTTLILEDETVVYLKEIAARESRTLTDVVTETLNRGLGRDRSVSVPWRCASFDMGVGFDYAKAWERIDELEASAVADKMELRK